MAGAGERKQKAESVWNKKNAKGRERREKEKDEGGTPAGPRKERGVSGPAVLRLCPAGGRGAPLRMRGAGGAGQVMKDEGGADVGTRRLRDEGGRMKDEDGADVGAKHLPDHYGHGGEIRSSQAVLYPISVWQMPRPYARDPRASHLL